MQVKYNATTFGTICDDGWGVPEATVACHQLGYSKYVSYFTLFLFYAFEPAHEIRVLIT